MNEASPVSIRFTDSQDINIALYSIMMDNLKLEKILLAESNVGNGDSRAGTGSDISGSGRARALSFGLGSGSGFP